MFPSEPLITLAASVFQQLLYKEDVCVYMCVCVSVCVYICVCVCVLVCVC